MIHLYNPIIVIVNKPATNPSAIIVRSIMIVPSSYFVLNQFLYLLVYNNVISLLFTRNTSLIFILLYGIYIIIYEKNQKEKCLFASLSKNI